MHPAPRFIQAVALDMDGLSLNTEDLYQEVGGELMRRRGKLFREEVRMQMMGRPAPQAYAVLIRAEGLRDTWQELQQEADTIFEDLLPRKVQAMPGLHEFLDELDRWGLPRCIATSSRRSFAEAALTYAGVRSRIDFIVTVEDVQHGKPSPDIYHLAASRMKVEPASVLVLEDSPVGTQAGVAAGCHVIAVPTPHTAGGIFTGAKDIAKHLADPIILAALHRHRPV